MLIRDSQETIPEHVQQNKTLFRVDRVFYCDACGENNKMLDTVWVRKDKLTFFFNCECGNTSSVNTTEKQIYDEMIDYFYSDKEVLFFQMFQVAYFYKFWSDLESELDGLEIVKRIEKKFKFWSWFYKIRYWGHKT